MFNNVIWITGMPRSGTNWFAQIFASHPEVRLKLCPLFSYEFKNALDEHSGAAEWRALLRQVYDTSSHYMDQESPRRDGLVPTFSERAALPSTLAIKSNRFHHLTEGLLAKCPEIRFVGIIRNPCATIHSWLDNPHEFPAGADPMREWRSGACRKQGSGEFWGFDDWKWVSSLFLRLAENHPDRFFLARHETFVVDPENQTRQLFAKLGLDFPTQTQQFLRASHERHEQHARAVFKNPSTLHRWQRDLPRHIVAEIEHELAGTPLARFLGDA